MMSHYIINIIGTIITISGIVLMMLCIYAVLHREHEHQYKDSYKPHELPELIVEMYMVGDLPKEYHQQVQQYMKTWNVNDLPMIQDIT